MALDHNKKQTRAQISDQSNRISKAITPVPCGISRLSGHMTEAAEELGAIVEVTALASDRILTCAEAILDTECDNHEEFTALVIDQVTQILEACAFQDITGQRAARLEENLKKVEARIARASAGICIGRDVAPGGEDTERDARRKRLILHGPQSAQDAISQDSVDALFSAKGQNPTSRRARGSR